MEDSITHSLLYSTPKYLYPLQTSAQCCIVTCPFHLFPTSVLSIMLSVQQPRYVQPGILTIPALPDGEGLGAFRSVDKVALAMEEAQAMASGLSLGRHSGMQVLHPPHEEKRLMHA